MKENFTDSYVPQTLAWCTDDGSNNTTCKNITTTGSSAPTGKDYLGHIKEIFNKTEVTVSFPSASQIATASGQTFNNALVENLPKWLYDYPGLDGYWTTTPHADNSSNVWFVSYVGYLNSESGSYAYSYGVRPVITISKSDIQ